jgi:Tol biopolymer transport system component
MKRLASLMAAIAVGCAGGGTGGAFHVESLPADPVALTHRKTDEIEKVQKQIEARMQERARDKAKEVQRARPAPGSIEAIRDAFELRAMENAGIDLSARMALHTLPDERTVEAEFAAKGDRPAAWSGDHQRLLFLSERTGNAQLFEWSRQTDAVTQLTHGEDTVLDGCYGPGGAIAWSAGTPLQPAPGGTSGGMRIFVRLPGGAPRAVTPGPMDSAPAWSPTESLLVYQARGKSGADELVAIDPAAPAAPRFLANGRSPVFTPDGKWIVYSALTAKGWKIFRVRPDGSGKQYIAGGAMQEVEPSISRDGKWVLFTGYYEGKPYETDLMIRPFAGGKDRKLDFDDKPHRTTW